jgi:Domain of unknown function (DUF4304)
LATARDVYDELVKTRVAPGLRALGFRGSGRRYELPSATHWALLGLQASQWSDANELRFTVNLLVVSRQAWTEESARRPHLGAAPSPNRAPGAFAWWRRLGPLLPAGGDRWWTVGPGADADGVAREVLAAVELYGLPAVRAAVEAGAGGGEL